MATKKILTGDERKAQLLEAGAKLAAKHGSTNVTRRMVAKAVKCAESLVTVYMGSTGDAQKAYAKHAKKLGLTEPDKAKQLAIGTKLRAHKPRDARDTRKRSAKEVRAIKDKQSPAKPKASPAVPRQSPRKPITSPAKRATAARKPKAPPPLPSLPMPS